MATYGGMDGGVGINPRAARMAAMLGQGRRIRPGGRRRFRRAGPLGAMGQKHGQPMLGTLPHGLPHPGAMQAMQANMLAGGGQPIQAGPLPTPDLAAAQGHIQGMMGQTADPTMGSVTWGGQTFEDPNKLWGWEQKHGNTMGKGKFWQLHPDAARRLGMNVGQDPADMGDEDPMNSNDLRQGIVNQLMQAQGALQGSPVAGVQRRVARRMAQQGHRRLQHVGAAQGRAQALAAIMARKLRGQQA